MPRPSSRGYRCRRQRHNGPCPRSRRAGSRPGARRTRAPSSPRSSGTPRRRTGRGRSRAPGRRLGANDRLEIQQDCSKMRYGSECEGEAKNIKKYPKIIET